MRPAEVIAKLRDNGAKPRPGGLRRVAPTLGVVCVTTAAILSGGCTTQIEPIATPTDVAPPDFALVVTVETRRTPPGHPMHLRPAQHVVEADGTFRAAMGPGTHHRMLPAVTARLGPQELDRLWQLADGLTLIDPAVPNDADAKVRLNLQAGGQTRRGTVDAEAAQPLLRRLAELRGDGPAGP